MDRGEIALHGYTVEQAANGGWVVWETWHSKEYPKRLLGAFDDHKSLIAFLADEHDAHANRVRPQGEPA